MSILFRHPVKKLTLLAAFGAGYVLGAKAGRERYDQILSTANQVKEDPRVQQAAARAEDLVRETTGKVVDDRRVKDVVSRAEDILRDAGVKHDDAPAGSHRLETDDEPQIPVPPVPPPPAPPVPPAAQSPAATADDRDLPLEDEVVYSTGPDVEETIDELIDLDSPDSPSTDPDRDDR